MREFTSRNMRQKVETKKKNKAIQYSLSRESF